MALLLLSNRKQFQHFQKSQGSLSSSGQTADPCKGPHQSLQTWSKLIKEGSPNTHSNSPLWCPPCPGLAFPSSPLDCWPRPTISPSPSPNLIWASLLFSETPKLPVDPWCQGMRGVLNINRNKPSSRCPPLPSPPTTPRGSPLATHTPLSIKEGDGTSTAPNR